MSRAGAAGTGPGPWPSVVPGWAVPGPCGLRRAGPGSGCARGGEELGVRAGRHGAGQGSPCAARELGRSCAGPVGRVPRASPVIAGLPRAVPAPSQGAGLGVAAPRSCARRRLCPRSRPELPLGGRGPGTALARCRGALTQTELLRAQSHTWGHRVLLSRPPRIASTSPSLPAGPGLPFAHRQACEGWGLRGPRGMRVT